MIHPVEALSRGIKDGDKVIVSTKRGEVEYYAKVSEAIPTGVVEINVGGGTPIQVEKWKAANANKITDINNRDPISGFPVLKALLCQVRKAEQ